MLDCEPNRILPLSLYLAFFSVCSSETGSLASSFRATSGVLGLERETQVVPLTFAYRAVLSSRVFVALIALPCAVVLLSSSRLTTSAAPEM